MKLPFLKFYPADWFAEKGLALCNSSVRGVWFDLLMMMHLDGQTGMLSGTVEHFAKWGRCTLEEAIQALQEIAKHKIADISCNENVTLMKRDCNAIVTLTNRRMAKLYKTRMVTYNRVMRYRDKNQTVTPVKRKSNSIVTACPPTPSPFPPQSPSLIPSLEPPFPPVILRITSPKGASVVLHESVKPVFEKWQKYRRGLGHKPKDWAEMFGNQAEWLAEFAPEVAVEILKQSMRNNWRGLFEPKAGTAKMSATKAGSEQWDYSGELK